jgi:glutamate racemase
LLLDKITRWLKTYWDEHKVQCVAQGALEADSLADYLVRHPEYSARLSKGGSCHFLTTENADRFSQSASIFLSSPVKAEKVILGS